MKYLIANWKMHSPPLPAWAQAVSKASVREDDQIVLCPPFTQLAAAQMVLANTNIALGAQDCHYKDEGAFTGDIAADMLKRVGCAFVIVGHSERRQYHHEDDAMVQAKADNAIDHGLVPIICVGESLAEREAGQAEAVVRAQLEASVPNRDEPMLVAYEPVWAIGTGLTAQTADIMAMHTHMKKILAQPLPVLYGGSVKPANAAAILSLECVDGVLVGSASLQAESFSQIIQAV